MPEIPNHEPADFLTGFRVNLDEMGEGALGIFNIDSVGSGIQVNILIIK